MQVKLIGQSKWTPLCVWPPAPWLAPLLPLLPTRAPDFSVSSGHPLCPTGCAAPKILVDCNNLTALATRKPRPTSCQTLVAGYVRAGERRGGWAGWAGWAGGASLSW